jgi:hypothetical protein
MNRGILNADDTKGAFMSREPSKMQNRKRAKFTPNMDNFKISLSYEGLSLKKENKEKDITELKKEYSRNP